MTSLAYFQHLVIGDYGTDIIVFAGRGGKGKQTVQTRYLVRVNLNGGNELVQRLYQLCVKLCFQYQYFVFGTEYLLFVLFQFLRNVAFGIDQRLLANPFLRHFIFVHVAHFDIVTEHIVITYLQAGNPRLFALPLLYLQKIVLTGISYLTQLVQLGIHAGFYHAAFIDEQRGIVVDFLIDAVTNGAADVQLPANVVQTGVIGIHTGFLNRLDCLQSYFQGNHLTRRDTPHGYFGDDTFQVTYQMQLLFNQFLEVGLAEEILHYVQSLINGLHIFQGEHHPALQQTGSHRTDSFVYHVQQAAAAVVHTAHQLQAAHRKLIQADVFVFFYARQRSDMPYLRMLRQNEVLQDSPRSNDTVLEMFHAESFQILYFKVFQQLLAGGGFRKYPVFQLECKELAAEVTLKHSPTATFKKHFFRSKVIQQLVHIVERPFGGQELTRRDVQECHAASTFTEVNGGKEVVFPVIQYVVVNGHARCYQLGDTAFHQFLGELRVFQLVANGYALACTYQLGQIRIERMMRKTGHFNRFPFAIGTLCQGNA